jgi:hypothetical protein
MRGAIRSLPHTSSWRGAELSTGTSLSFIFIKPWAQNGLFFLVINVIPTGREVDRPLERPRHR